MGTDGPAALPKISEVKAVTPVCHQLVIMTQDMALDQLCRFFMDSEDPEGYLDIVEEVYEEVRTSYVQAQQALPLRRQRLPKRGELP